VNNVPVVGAGEIASFLWSIANFVINIGIVVAVIFIALNGYKFFTSSSNPQRRTESMVALGWSILGGIVVVGAKFFAGVILGLKPM
jgi:hypothetical protein